ncbi:GNAT family N-acetyltransferase [Pseudidiomarina tainanensis]|jgi:ribosomal protein S18 acetylase RimI-like enzyme|uniref:Acetyltransferase (GNAT) domain-containing protein n=2 Tax=Pseudidiomarina TaxID=2800384 RepID=A0A1I6GH46_9GAMM|nr:MULTISPECIES: GNAT family N-acetyltransferase [Pseudidiomarina]RZQ56668.1 GNAT family N-acetyltransferase [Pseudidiomarina tainanensis]SFR41397.1 Acetyltransferase (GNAT) domain-containing protein [Pseudidiomarina maritima]
MTTINPAQLREGQLTYLVAEDLKMAASLLYQAYHDDALLMAIFQAEKPDYEKRLRAAIREELMAFWEAQQPMLGVFDGDSLIGVVCLTQPGKSFGPGKYWHWRLKMLLTAGYVSTMQLLEKERLIQEAVGGDDYHMLAFIAVSPRYQQQGWGDLLVRAAQAALDEEPQSRGLAVYVTQPQHLKLFEQNGYELVQELDVGDVHGKLLFQSRAQANEVNRAV